jgi:hypothetical protein
MRINQGPSGPDDVEIAADASPAELIAPVYAQAMRAMRGVRTALAAESAAAELLGLVSLAMMSGIAEEEYHDALAHFFSELVGHARRDAKPASLALLRAMGAVAPSPLAEVARETADLLAETGVKDRPWAAIIGRPTPMRCWRYGTPGTGQESVTVTFGYRGQEHAVSVLIDHDLGGGVKDCWVSDDPNTLWQKTSAQFTRDPRTEFGPIPFARARDVLQAALAAAPCPVEDDQVEDVAAYLPMLRARVGLLTRPSGDGSPAGPTADSAAGPLAGTIPKSLRGQASRVAGPAEVLRLKVNLKWASPPIWRRLEVSDSITLDELHHVLQAAFGWDGGHLHSFEDGDRTYGDPHPDLDFISEVGVRLTAITPVGGSLEYTYDFGDCWDHDVQMEKRVPAEDGVAYPRCIGGRRAAPPDDCGGVGGYGYLLDAIKDPANEEHEQMVEWLGGIWGLDAAEVAAFDPAHFDVADVNEMLAPLALRAQDG